MNFTYVLFQDDPSNSAEYAALIAEYDIEGEVAKEGRDEQYFLKPEDGLKDQEGNYEREEDGRIKLKEGKYYWRLSKLKKADFEALEEQGIFLEWSYTEGTLSKISSMLEQTFISDYWTQDEI